MASRTSSDRGSLVTPKPITTGKGRPPPAPPHPQTSSSSGKTRIPHACDRCRLMRTKCSGGQQCLRCIKDDAVCVYGDNKRERNRKDFVDSVNRVKELEDDNRVLVAAVRQATSSGDARSLARSEILDVLSKYSDEEQGASLQGSRSQSRSTKSPKHQSDSDTKRSGGEGKVASSIGSPGHQGELRKVINVTHGAGASGFIGKMSEISWMQRCREYLIDHSDTNMTDIHQPELDQHAAAVLDLAYFTDDQDPLSVDEDMVDLDPPRLEDAMIISEAFFYATHGALYFFSRAEFWEYFSTIYQSNATLTWLLRRRLAVANMVWSIGSKWLYMAKLESTTSSSLHLVFYARARALGLDHRVALDHPDVEMVQGMGLLAFYLLMNGSITRAWNTIGNAVRHATTLGLHLRVTDPSISEFDQGRRFRTWFSLYKLQTLVAEITGRPQLLRYVHVTIPLEILEQKAYMPNTTGVSPIILELCVKARSSWLQLIGGQNITDQPMSDHADRVPRLSDISDLDDHVPQQAFLYHVRLCQLTEDIAEALYTGRQEVPWSETQYKIAELQEDLDAWSATLPDELKLDRGWEMQGHARVKLQLAMYLCSTNMILHRPCLCDIQIEEESERSKKFNQYSAQACVNGAISMLDLIPDQSTAAEMYHLLPWWTLLHYLCQAASVLLIEICLNVQHFPTQRVPIAAALTKAMSRLACLTAESKSAYRAWRIFYDSIQTVNARPRHQDIVIGSILAHPPSNWTDADESAMTISLGETDG